MKQKNITILSVSFYSYSHLKRLFENLMSKARKPSQIKLVIVDNTNGKDTRLKELEYLASDINIIKNNGEGLQRSISHASALDKGLRYVDTKYCLIIDPDTYIFKSDWDTFCLSNLLEKNVVIGAPYPEWKIGKVHDFPSVIFMFFRTNEIKNLRKNFYPFPSFYRSLYNFIFRKVNRLGFIANKRFMNRYIWLRSITGLMENLFGITSPDTGNKIIKSFQRKNFTSITFNAIYGSDILVKHSKNLSSMANEFELYFYKKEPILTHMYSSGVFHWKTKKGSDINYWKLLINKIEKN